VIYWLYTDAHPFIMVLSIPLLILAISIPLITVKRLGSGKSLGEGIDIGVNSLTRGLRKASYVILPLAIVCIVISLTGSIALVKINRASHLSGFLELLVGGPPSYDKQHMLLVVVITLCAAGFPSFILSQGYKSNGWLRQMIDRWSRPRTTRGELGSAHFCSNREFGRYRKPDPEGIVFYGAFYDDKKQRIDQGIGKFCLTLEDAARGILTLGGPGSGKTQAVILPVIADSMLNKHSLIVVDPQGEITPEIIKLARVTNHQVIVHDPTSTTGPRYNIAEGIESVSDATAIATVLIKSDGSGGDMSFWTQSAAMLLAGCLLRFPNLGEISMALTDYKKLAQKLSEKADDAAQIANSFIASAAGPDGKMASSVIATLSTSLEGWADATVRSNTSTSDFDIEDFINQPSVIVLTCPGRKRAVYARYLGATLRSLMLKLDTIGEQNRHPTKKARLPVPVNIILDEFPTLGRLDSLVSDVNLVRKRGISILIGAQTKGQFELIYGRDGTTALLTGLATQIIYGGCDAETAEFYSKSAGTTTTNTSKDPTKNNARQRQLLTPDEIVSPLIGNMTIFARYVTENSGGQAVLNGELTRMYQREDWAAAIKASENKPVRLLERSEAPILGKLASKNVPAPAATLPATATPIPKPVIPQKTIRSTTIRSKPVTEYEQLKENSLFGNCGSDTALQPGIQNLLDQSTLTATTDVQKTVRGLTQKIKTAA